ncbi:MAG: aldo/keto reductase [Varibaculum sp.]|nr:aldo/keto reductase [Varibaculum sp.]
MRYSQVGKTGLQVSTLGLGTLTWGQDTDIHEAADMLDTYISAGGNLLECSAWYGSGAALDALGKLLARDDIDRTSLNLVISPFGVPDSATGRYLPGRGWLLTSLDSALQVLGTDYLDVWNIPGSLLGRIRMEELTQTIATAVSSGKVRYVSCSGAPAWMIARLHTLLETQNLEVAALSSPYSLLSRGAEEEYFDMTKSLGIGFFAVSVLAAGVLTGKYRVNTPPDSRGASPLLSFTVEPYLKRDYLGTVDALAAAAEGLNKTAAQLALNWSWRNPAVSCAITGPRTSAQLNQLLDAADSDVPHQIAHALDQVS